MYLLSKCVASRGLFVQGWHYGWWNLPCTKKFAGFPKVLDGLAGLSPANIVALNLFLSDVSFHSSLVWWQNPGCDSGIWLSTLDEFDGIFRCANPLMWDLGDCDLNQGWWCVYFVCMYIHIYIYTGFLMCFVTCLIFRGNQCHSRKLSFRVGKRDLQR